MEVISLEEGKVKILDRTVIKKSSIAELEHLKSAYDKICGEKIALDSAKFEIIVPKILDYKDESIVMERCFGNNLELMLRDTSTHKKASFYTNEILKEFLKKKFLWKDFAPRNILIDDGAISIMDFERGIDSENVSLPYYFLDSVYEEYGAFLLPDERIYKMDETLNIDSELSINMSDIKSKRVRTILSKLGYHKKVPISMYVYAVKMIIINEEPYKFDNDIVFPLIELEEYLSKYGYDKYADKIIGGFYEKNRSL